MTSEFSTLLSSTDSPWVASIPAIVSAIISFFASLLVAFVSYHASKSVVRSTEATQYSKMRNDYKEKLQFLMAAIYSYCEPKRFDAPGFRDHLLESSNQLRFQLIEHIYADSLIDQLDMLEDIKKADLHGWRVEFLQLSSIFLSEFGGISNQRKEASWTS